MNFIRLICILILLSLSPVKGFTQSCPFSLVTNYPNGAKGCLTDLPLSKVVDKSWGRQISVVAQYAKYYSIAASSVCNYSAIGTSQRIANFGKTDAEEVALSKCPSECSCAIVVDNGKVLLPQNLASLIGVNSETVAGNLNSQDKANTQINSNSETAKAEKNKALAEIEAAKQKEVELAQEVEKKRIAEVKRKIDLEAQAQKDRELEISKQRDAEAIKLAEAQKIKDVQTRLKAEAESKERDRLLALAAEKEKIKAQESEKQRQLAETEGKEREKQLLAAVDEQKQKALLAKQDAEKLALLASNEVSERQKDRELLLLLSAELAKLKAQQQNNSQQIVTNQNPSTTNKVEPPKPLPIFANRKALVIGNDGYKFVSKLLNAKEDANAIAENLTKVGYKVTLKLDQTEKEMKASLRNFKAQVEAGDEVAFFYAGHGVQLANTNYLLPIDVAGEGEEQIKDEAISLQRILDDMSDKKVKFTLAMIDACRDNPFKSSGRSIGGGARGLAPTTAATGQMVVFSAGTGQQALDKLGPNDKDKNGLFTRLFIKEMQKTGITIDQLVRSVRNEVVTTAKSIGHDQVPAIYDQVVGEFYFRK
jgi:hypothetical protein